MTAALALARRTRQHVRSVDDVTLLVRVVVVLLCLPAALRLPWPRLVRCLERVSAVIGVEPGRRADRIDFYVRACGGIHRGPLQDNCVARSLARFALLNHPARPLDVRVGVRVEGSGPGGPCLGRRHVWLTTADGEPFLESEQVDDYVVQFRYRDCVATARSDSLARFAVVLGASGVASAALAIASVARTKLVAVGLGAPGLALAGQMTLAVNVLGWISNFGGSGTARLVADALSRGDVGAAATVTRTTALLLLGAALVIVGLAAPAVTPLAVMVFGDPSAASWIVWLLAVVPLAALASLGAAVLRGAQQAGRLAAVRIAAAVMSVVACLLLVQPGDLALVAFVPLALVAANAAGMGAAAWPICRPWLSAKGAWFAAGVARRVAADGLANVFMGLTTSAAMLAVGRHYLAAGDLDTAGRIVALAWFSEPLAAAFVAGHSASTYPAYAAARGPAADAVLARGVRGLVVVAVPVLAVVAIAAGPIVGVAFSPALADVAALVPLMALAAYMRSATMVLGMPLLARGRLIALSTIHAGWAMAIAMGALGFAAPGLAGASAFVRAYVLATLVQAVVLVGVLRRSGLHAGGSDLAWLASGAAPLIWLALAR